MQRKRDHDGPVLLEKQGPLTIVTLNRPDANNALDDAVREIGQVVESLQTADEVMRQASAHGVELPISSNVRDVLHGDISPAEGLRRLMAREQKAEYPQSLFHG